MNVHGRLLNALFPLLVATTSKSLRELVFKKIISDLRSSNAKSTNHKLNRSVQNLLIDLLSSDKTSSRGLWAVKITRELWKRQIWTDEKAVKIMEMAALSDNEKVIVGGVRFFLGGDKEREEQEDEGSSDEEGANIDMGALRHQAGINKKTKKREKELKRAAATVKRKEKKKHGPHPLNFSALHLLHHPQGFAEELFKKHLQSQKGKLNLEQRLFVLQLVTRLVGLHQLTIETLYSWFLKFLTPRQQSVTTYLACLAQATHAQVPDDHLKPCLQKIANEFVSEASASEVASAGLNAIREICARQPLAMDDTLLQDLVMYRKSKDKGVMMAAKGLLSLYREKDPEKLKRRDRGKDASIALQTGDFKQMRFGEVTAHENIDGIELLEAWKEEERKKKRAEQGLGSDDEDQEADLVDEEEAGWNNWDAESDDSDSSGGWINVESDGEDINISDSEDDEDSRPNKKAKTEETAARASAAPTEASTTTNAAEKKKSDYATTRILTPADLAKLRELQTNSSVLASLPSHQRKRAELLAKAATRSHEDGLTAEQIEGLAFLSNKKTKEEKIAAAKGDRDEKHQSTTAKRKEKKRSEGKSTTNKEKARQKNFLMTLGKAKRKGKRSLTEVRSVMKGHVERSKRGGRRGNK
jgi:protein SDA1